MVSQLERVFLATSGVEARDTAKYLTMHRAHYPSTKNYPAQNAHSGKAENPCLRQEGGVLRFSWDAEERFIFYD